MFARGTTECVCWVESDSTCGDRIDLPSNASRRDSSLSIRCWRADRAPMEWQGRSVGWSEAGWKFALLANRLAWTMASSCRFMAARNSGLRKNRSKFSLNSASQADERPSVRSFRFSLVLAEETACCKLRVQRTQKLGSLDSAAASGFPVACSGRKGSCLEAFVSNFRPPEFHQNAKNCDASLPMIRLTLTPPSDKSDRAADRFPAAQPTVD